MLVLHNKYSVAEVCDARDDAICNAAGPIKILLLFIASIQPQHRIIKPLTPKTFAVCRWQQKKNLRKQILTYTFG